MLFKIINTSGNSEYDKPCKNAIDTSPSECLYYKEWNVEINTLEDLLNLKEEVGEELIITNTYRNEPVIEIYDDYRERG